MVTFNVQMFGKLRVESRNQTWDGPEGGKVRELFCFLLSHLTSSYSREAIAEMLWGECSSVQSKKKLRQTLWRLQSECEARIDLQGRRLAPVKSERISLNPEIGVRVDVADFEEAYSLLQKRCEPDSRVMDAVRAAVNSYRGEFLDGWYQDWCVYERERLQSMYLTMLDRLIGHCLRQGEYEEGKGYCQQLLHHDPASERTHRQLMKLHCLAGDRTAALRQYERCVNALKEELGVNPDRRSVELYEQLKSDRPAVDSNSNGFSLPNSFLPAAETGIKASAPDILNHLKQFQDALTEMQREIQRDIQLVEKLTPEREGKI